VVEKAAADWAPVSVSGYVVRDTLSARVAPRAALAALVAAVRALGGKVVTEAEDAGMVVHASGPWGLAALGQAMGRKVGSGVKGQAALLAHDARDCPQIFAAGLYLVPHADGTVAVGSTSETQWTAEGPDAQLDDLIATARRVMPALTNAKVLERWSGIRPRASTRQLTIGAWPDRPGHYIANGGFKIGFGMAPKMAETMADLILDGHDTIPDGFRVDRLIT